MEEAVIPFTVSAIKRIVEHAALQVFTGERLDAVTAKLARTCEWRREQGYGAPMCEIDANDVDIAVLVCCYGAGDANGGFSCTWEYGQAPGMLWAGATKTRNCRGVTFRIGNMARNTFYRSEARVMGVHHGRLLVGQAGWPLLSWDPDDCRLI